MRESPLPSYEDANRVSAGVAGFHPANSAVREFGRRFEAQLLLDVLAVGLDSLNAQMEGLGNLTCAPP